MMKQKIQTVKSRSPSKGSNQARHNVDAYQESLILEAVGELVGADVTPIVKILLRKDSVSEYDLADAIKKDINQTRNLLYALHRLNLVYSVRKKDKIKGWYIYYWSFDRERTVLLYKKMQLKKIDNLNSILEKEEKGSFFICPNKCTRVEYEQAMELHFKCPECGALMEKEDNSKRVEELKAQIESLKKHLQRV
jgi:transcription initiation factor TFIIE subunit alpha